MTEMTKDFMIAAFDNQTSRVTERKRINLFHRSSVTTCFDVKHQYLKLLQLKQSYTIRLMIFCSNNNWRWHFTSKRFLFGFGWNIFVRSQSIICGTRQSYPISWWQNYEHFSEFICNLENLLLKFFKWICKDKKLVNCFNKVIIKWVLQLRRYFKKYCDYLAGKLIFSTFCIFNLLIS